MKKKLIKESFEWSYEKRMGRNGEYYAIFIDPKFSTESTFKYKDTIKNKFKFQWDPNKRTWYTMVSSNPDVRKTQIEKYVKPCVEYLKSVEASSNGRSADDEITKLINDINGVIASLSSPEVAAEIPNSPELESKLEDFKVELINSFKDNTFKEKMGPIIKFRQAQGIKYSLLNCILIYIQKKDAKMVKSTSRWADVNKNIKPNATPISLWVPIGQRAHTPEECEEIKNMYFKKKSKKYGRPITDIKQLNPAEREELDIALKKVVPLKFDLKPRFYDISDTIQMEGKEDLVGSLDGIDNVDWFDADSSETPETVRLYDAIIGVIENTGINLNYADDLNGARGVSIGGEIQVLKNAPKNAGTVNTLIHEFSHELLHQRFAKTKDNDKFGGFFVGRPEGTELVEQQAEICAWVVMRNFGFDMQQSKNYVACWGGDDVTASFVFDSIARVASYIIDEINSHLKSVNESVLSESTINGIDVAQLLGPEAVQAYNRGKQEAMNQIQEQFNKILNKINNPF